MKSISVRLDADAAQALQALEDSGMSRSDAIRTSLIASARRFRRGTELAAEGVALDGDESDRAEMQSVVRLMEALSNPVDIGNAATPRRRRSDLGVPPRRRRGTTQLSKLVEESRSNERW